MTKPYIQNIEFQIIRTNKKLGKGGDECQERKVEKWTNPIGDAIELKHLERTHHKGQSH